MPWHMHPCKIKRHLQHQLDKSKELPSRHMVAIALSKLRYLFVTTEVISANLQVRHCFENDIQCFLHISIVGGEVVMTDFLAINTQFDQTN
jgi:hypothetical protein